MRQVTTPREERQNPTTGWSGAAGASLGAVIMSAGRAPRIASASIPASPAGTGQAATVTAAASAQCRVPVSYLRV